MKSLLIIAHGSRREEANEEVIRLVKIIEKKSADLFSVVKPAFLEIVKPTAQEQIDRLIIEGSRQIVIFPYFLARGRHVKVDLPQIIREAQERYPEISFKLTNHLGGLQQVSDMILGEVSQS